MSRCRTVIIVASMKRNKPVHYIKTAPLSKTVVQMIRIYPIIIMITKQKHRHNLDQALHQQIIRLEAHPIKIIPLVRLSTMNIRMMKDMRQYTMMEIMIRIVMTEIQIMLTEWMTHWMKWAMTGKCTDDTEMNG